VTQQILSKLKLFFPRKHNNNETVATHNQESTVDSILKNRNNRRLILFNFEMR